MVARRRAGWAGDSPVTPDVARPFTTHPEGAAVAISEYTVRVHDEGNGTLWAEVVELPGCYASGVDLAELFEAVGEAIPMYLTEVAPPVPK